MLQNIIQTKIRNNKQNILLTLLPKNEEIYKT